eukprot:2493551-Rhodomonas_salina.2
MLSPLPTRMHSSAHHCHQTDHHGAQVMELNDPTDIEKLIKAKGPRRQARTFISGTWSVHRADAPLRCGHVIIAPLRYQATCVLPTAPTSADSLHTAPTAPLWHSTRPPALHTASAVPLR